MYYTQDGAKQQAAATPPVIFAPPQPQYMPAVQPAVPSGPFMWSGHLGAVPSTGAMGRMLGMQQGQLVGNAGLQPMTYRGQQSYPGYMQQQPVVQQVYGVTADGRRVLLR